MHVEKKDECQLVNNDYSPEEDIILHRVSYNKKTSHLDNM
jgi:hypothetical protein